MGSFLGWLIVNFVLLLISFIAYSSQIFIIWPWYGQELSVELLVLLVPFNFFVAMLLWNYYLCVTTDPGHVPDSWKPDTHADGYEVKKLTGAPRFCRMCQKYKPPRAHHCRQCNRCILRMDHHCPWINNCVGHFNYGHFIRFLFYVDIACSYHLVMISMRVVDAMRASLWDEPSSIELIFIILNYVTCGPVLLAVGIFSLYHFYGLLGNTTTIEWWEKDRAATMVRRGKIREIKFPYSLGFKQNVQSILGKNPLMWSCPTVTPGTGLKFELGEHYDATQAWPPKDPLILQSEPLDHAAVLASSPWTYENGGLNPDLQATNTRYRQSSSRTQTYTTSSVGVSSLPPYHPDYVENEAMHVGDASDNDTISISSDADLFEHADRVRSGSEGYEVRLEEREEMLKQYLQDLGEEPGRYMRYIPEPDTESDEDIPLHSVQDRRSQMSI
ncbi:palmitoyltransferase PFA4 [Cyathus striatus]|nr:palmitoyltransferase PFA4 [Cyathus striatus]